MSDEVKRRGNGQFRPGQSGNAAGARARRQKPLLTAADLDRIVMAVASSDTEMTINGVRQTGPLYKANVIGLASMNPTNRLASRDFLDLANRAAHRIENVHRQEPQALAVADDRFDHGT